MAIASLRILGRVWSVVWEPIAGLCGQSDHGLAKITIDPTLDAHLSRDTLLHEVMHSILRMQGHAYTKHEEMYVNSLATGLVTVLDENPALRKYLTKG